MKKNICIVVANYYPVISKKLINGATKVLKISKIRKYKVVKVPGIFEIPFVIAKNINKYDAFIALGCVIKGKTPHFDFISRSTINALMKLSVQNKKIIGNGIITCFNKKQALDRSNNVNNKGSESAKAVISLLKI